MSDKATDLLIWPGAWDLPTADRACLTALTYAKFSNVKINVTETGNTWKSPTGTFPVLKADGQKICYEDKIKYTIDKLTKIERPSVAAKNMTNSQEATSDCTDTAYLAMIKNKLIPAIKYMLWIDDTNMSQLMRPWLSKVLPFPLGMYVIGRMHKSVERTLENVYLPTDQYTINDQSIEQKVYKDAKECLNLISHKLDDKDYFSGDRPSYIDAVIFACVSIIYKCPVPNNHLQQHVKQCPNLYQYCDRILHRYYPHIRKEHMADGQSTPKTNSSSTKDVNSTIDPEFPHKTRNKILGALFALTAMVSYAFFSGLLQIETSGNREELSDIDNGLEEDSGEDEDE